MSTKALEDAYKRALAATKKRRRSQRRKGLTETWEVRSIDAWRDPEGGWTENASYAAGDLTLPPEASNREILKAMREQGYLTEGSKGKAAVEDLGGDDYYWIVNRSNGEPIFAVVAPEEID